MAKQHFYSSVPAKMSLFNKMDSYDTFAHSAGITFEQINNEISFVYDNKPTKEDTVLMRDGKLPTVYCQFATADNTVIQSAVSYIKSDYTGERSAYLVHSLLLDEKERTEHLESIDGAALNPDIFKKDIDGFDLTSFDSSPDTEYPEIYVPVKKVDSISHLVNDYDTGMLKRLIYALLGISCGKIRNLFISLPSSIDTLSIDSLNFINEILQIFPYHIRPSMSFVTYAGDISKFSHFKIKFIKEDNTAIPASKGIALKMGIKDYTGVSDENVAAHTLIVDFFYSLITGENARRDFIDFCKYAVEKIPSLNKISFKNLEDLVFLFKYLSGYFDEYTVLPNDDAVYSFVSVYDKYRVGLTNKYRAKAMDFLRRYPQNHTVIPKNVFNKISNMYPDEIDETRKTVMSVVLELIHTDVMRDRLFSFTKLFYDIENAETKALIMESVCRVYYGGFLQESILEFFTKYFPDEPFEIRNTIIERLLLTIRTPKIQQGVLNFTDKFYDIFNDNEKSKFYQTFYEMLPEGDELSREFIKVVDAHISEEDMDEVSKQIVSIAKKQLKKPESMFFDATASNCGFVEKTVGLKVFGEWSDTPAFDSFVKAICKKSLLAKCESVSELWSTVPDMNSQACESFYEAISQSIVNSKNDIFDIIEAIAVLNKLKSDVPSSASFVDNMIKQALNVSLDKFLPAVFDIRRYPDGIKKIAEIAQINDTVSNCTSYKLIEDYYNIVDAVKCGDIVKCLFSCASSDEKFIRQGIISQLKKDFTDYSFEENSLFCFETAKTYLENNTVSFSNSANALRDLLNKKFRENGNSEIKESDAQSIDEQILALVIDFGSIILGSDLPNELKASALTDTGSEMDKYITSFLNKYEKKGKKIFDVTVSKLSLASDYLTLIQGFSAKKSASKGFLKLFFK